MKYYGNCLFLMNIGKHWKEIIVIYQILENRKKLLFLLKVKLEEVQELV